MKLTEKTIEDLRKAMDDATILECRLLLATGFEGEMVEGYCRRIERPLMIHRYSEPEKNIYVEADIERNTVFIYQFVKNKGFEILHLVDADDYTKIALFMYVATLVDRIFFRK